jgi:uncharacterized low-complexity protein
VIVFRFIFNLGVYFMGNKESALLALSIGVVLGGTSLSSQANPFQLTDLNQGYMLASTEKAAEDKPASTPATKTETEKMPEGKCGEGKCGSTPATGTETEKMPEGKCGEGKCGNMK